MKSTTTCFLATFATTLALPALAQNQPPPPGGGRQGPGREAATEAAINTAPAVELTPTQLAHILKELEKVESQIGQGRGTVFSNALTKFRAALGSDSGPLALYLDCYKLEHYERKDLKQTDFTEWRDRNEDRLKNGDFGKALSLQLEYLVLSIQAQDVSDIRKAGPLVAAVQTYLGKMVTEVANATRHTASGAVEVKENTKGGGGQGGRRGPGGGAGNTDASPLPTTLRQSVKSSEFARAYMLEDYLDAKNWEYTPLNIGGIYNQLIFPYCRAVKPEELGNQWDTRINAELALRKAVMSDTEYGIYYKEEQPRMQWNKDLDLLNSNVNPVNALADMLKIIQANPNHPDASSWLEGFKAIVKKSNPDAPVESPTPTTGTPEKPAGAP